MMKEIVNRPLDQEPSITFKTTSDLRCYAVRNREINESLVEIKGYGLEINFNMKYLRTIPDVEAACEGISQMFRDILMERLLGDQRKEGKDIQTSS